MTDNPPNQEVPVLRVDEETMERLIVGVADYIQNAQASQNANQGHETTPVSSSSTSSGSEAVTSGNTGGLDFLCYTVKKGIPDNGRKRNSARPSRMGMG